MNTTDDAGDANAGDGICDTDLVTDGLQCSLRAAVQQSNENEGADTIQLPAGTYTLTIEGIEDESAAGDLDVLDDLTISGASGVAVVEAGPTLAEGIDRVLHVHNTRGLELQGVTLRHGLRPNAPGGAIYSAGVLRIVNSTIADNSALNGGGVFNDGGSVEIIDSTVANNAAGTAGGGVLSRNGSATVAGSTISGNSAGGNGGGMINQNTELDVTNSTFSDNQAGIDGGALYNEGGEVVLDGSDILDNVAAANGGGLNSEEEGATLLVMNSTIRGNTAIEFNGGGIDAEFFSTSVSVINTTVSENSAGSNGGGIYVFQNTDMTIEDTTIDGNVATFNGAGLYYGGTGQATVTNSTISGNSTGSFGGGVFSDRVSALTNVTISGNDADGNGGGIWVRANTTILNGTITANTADADDNGVGDGGGVFWTDQGGNAFLKNTILAGNFDPTSDPDCFGRITSHGYNLIETVSAGCEVVGETVTNITGKGALLGLLADNGGPTLTHALLPDSPARDAVEAGCPPPDEDQRGVERPLGDFCDIGAFEAASGIKGDTDCDEDIDSVDALWVLRDLAALPVTAKCLPAGNVDCDNDRDSVDALFILRHVAALPVNLPQGCTAIGAPL